MTREEAIKILSCRDNRGVPIAWQDGFVDAVDMAVEALQAQATLDDVSNAYENGYQQGKFEATQWIPCSERLPEEPKPNKELEGKPLDIYLVCKKGNIPFRAFWNGKNFADGWTTLDVDAWMPLPERYTEE